MSEIVPWDELTPAAQQVIRDEVLELVEKSPADDEKKAIIYAAMGRNPATIPHVLASLKRRLA